MEENLNHNSLLLASGDVKGNIFIWNVHQSTIIQSFQGKKLVLFNLKIDHLK
jgi:hypothetical protein